MNHSMARAVSLIGHPMLVLPAALLILAATNGHAGQAWRMGLGFVVFAALVMAYSWWQVRRGRWGHVDASQPAERGALNRFLLLALAAAALLSLRSGPRELTLALALAALIVLVALRTARWWKLSLHLAFAVFAALLLSVLSAWAAIAGLLFAATIAWSRLQLQRHVARDLLAGAATGGLAGMLFLFSVNGGTG